MDIVLAAGSKVPAAHLPLEGKERRRPHVVRFYYGVLKNPTRYDQGLFVSPNSSFALPVSIVLLLDGCCYDCQRPLLDESDVDIPPWFFVVIYHLRDEQ
jgi:hypothetical protein